MGAERPVDTTNAATAAAASENPLVALVALGQSIWLDYITRDLVRGGELRRLIEQDGLRGMTSNPTIFQKAIAGGSAYDAQIEALLGESTQAGAIFEALAVQDIQDACDLFRPLYDRTDAADGYVSIEVSPHVAHDTAGTLTEARRLWQTVGRPNVMIKVPGTEAGLPAVVQLLGEGVNVNITLLFARERHEQVMWAYIEALEQRATAGLPIAHIASVASFFVSRVDTLVDRVLQEQIAATGSDETRQEQLRVLLGKSAIANARLAYARFREIFGSERFAALRARGAQVQRPLWASTSAKDPAYRDVVYVEQLIGPDTVNTLPHATLQAFQNHGQVRRTLDTDLDDAQAIPIILQQVGIDFAAITRQLEDEGLATFAASYDELIAGVEQKRIRLRT